MNKGNYFEAFGLLKRQYQLGPQIHFAPVLVKYFVALMQTDRADKVGKIRDELAELLKNKFSDSADEIYKYAESLLDENKLWEAVLFYQVSMLYCEKPSSNYDSIQLLQWNVYGLTDCVCKIFSANPGSKKLLKQHVICWMKKAQDWTARALGQNQKISSLIQANLLAHQGKCLHYFQELNEAEKLYKEAVEIMEHYHESEAENFRCFACYLKHLGIFCYQTQRLNEAEKYFNRSMNAAKKAKDFGTYDRNAFIQCIEKTLTKIKKHQK